MAKCRGGALSPRKTGRPRATGALSSPPSTLAAVNPAFDHETARLRGELDGLLAKAKQDGSTSIALGTLSELRRLTMDRENIGIERAWLEQGPAHINVNVTAVRNVIAAMLDEIAKLPAKHRDRILKVIEGLPDDAA